MGEHPDPLAEVSWKDACWAMMMECDEHEAPECGFETPSAELVAKYCRLYPRYAEDFIDFAATCEAQDRLLKLFPPRQPTEAELGQGVKRAMRAFRRALRREQRKKRSKGS